MHVTPDTLPTGHAGIAARLKKGPTVHSSAWVVPGATVIGDVILAYETVAREAAEQDKSLADHLRRDIVAVVLRAPVRIIRNLRHHAGDLRRRIRSRRVVAAATRPLSEVRLTEPCLNSYVSTPPCHRGCRSGRLSDRRLFAASGLRGPNHASRRRAGRTRAR